MIKNDFDLRSILVDNFYLSIDYDFFFSCFLTIDGELLDEFSNIGGSNVDFWLQLGEVDLQISNLSVGLLEFGETIRESLNVKIDLCSLLGESVDV